jgi:hypothetical protein
LFITPDSATFVSYFIVNPSKAMKKLLFILLATVLLGIVASCTSNQHCAAYGEKQRYQIERR